MKKNFRYGIIILIICLVSIILAALNFNLSTANAEYVEQITSTPRITVLTPGVGGGPNHWSHDNVAGNFLFDKNSIIENLRSINENLSVYMVGLDENGFFLHISFFK